MPFEISRILHASLIVKNTSVALNFYHDILGLEIDNARPQLGFPGAWLNIGSQQLHLLELPNPDPVAGRPQHGGRDRHTALAVDDLDALQHKLEIKNVKFTRSQSGRKALFVRDPDGNALEFIEL